MEAIGRVNRYVCEKCGAVHGTINLNTGTTPFMIRCKSCEGMAQSSMYRLPGAVVAMQETDEVYEKMSGCDLDRWLSFIAAAYQPDSALFHRIVRRLKWLLNRNEVASAIHSTPATPDRPSAC